MVPSICHLVVTSLSHRTVTCQSPRRKRSPELALAVTVALAGATQAVGMNAQTWLLYGANGFTGRMIAREAVRRGLRPVIAGRNERAVARLARELELPFRCFALNTPQEADAGLRLCRWIGIVKVGKPIDPDRYIFSAQNWE